ncbi:protein kinase [Dactylosporangium sp. CA-233914]|uniref:protein kinase n=1 Tax=Dactylosporangium sp. CA-233914 TaxID=3239934 RepID=UPI003D8DDD66
MEIEGRYRLDRLAGAGGTAEIWHGADRLLHRPVAVRLPREGGPVDAERFLAGGRIAARLVHGNIAAVYDVGVADLPGRGPTPYVVMELADGPSLADRLEAGLHGGPMPWRDAARTGAQVAAALAHAHGQWVAHGALTPAKILLTDVGAKIVGFRGDADYDPSAAAADVHALGAVLAACLGGHAGAGRPAALLELVERCLSADPQARPSSDEAALVLAEVSGTAVDLPAWLNEAAESRRTAVLTAIRPETPRPPTRPARVRRHTQPRRWALRTAAVTLGVAVVLAGTVGALGSAVTGVVPWFGHSAEVGGAPAEAAPPTGQDVVPTGADPATTEPLRPTATATTTRNRPVTTSPRVPHSASASPSASVSAPASPSPSPSQESASPSPSVSASTASPSPSQSGPAVASDPASASFQETSS